MNRSARGWLAAVLLALQSLVTAPTAADTVTAQDPSRIVDLVRQAGHSADLVTTAYGDPLVRARAGDVPFQIRFYGCRDGADCLSVQFVAGFTGAALSPEDANDWNRATRYARVWSEGADAWIAHDINLDAGGIPEASFAASLAQWEAAMRRFMARIGW